MILARAIIKTDKILPVSGVLIIRRIYVYHCYGGSHSSVTAASIHVGLLAPNQVPSSQVLQSLPYFDTQKSYDHGVLQFVGTDKDDNLVFSIGLETIAQPVIKGLLNVLAISGQQNRELSFVDTLPAVNFAMKAGGVCSRVLGLKSIGRPLVSWGVRMAYSDICALVKRREEL